MKNKPNSVKHNVTGSKASNSKPNTQSWEQPRTDRTNREKR